MPCWCPSGAGYGRSDGPSFSEEVAGDFAQPNFVSRMQLESDDVLAAVDFLASVPFVDRNRLAIMGWSFGGIVTMLAASRSSVFRAAVNQAGGTLVWDRSPVLRQALIAAARSTHPPVLLTVAQNDRTMASITTLADILRERNPATELIVYPPFNPVDNPRGRGVAPGHMLFSDQGSAVWQGDLRTFLAKHLGGNPSAPLR